MRNRPYLILLSGIAIGVLMCVVGYGLYSFLPVSASSDKTSIEEALGALDNNTVSEITFQNDKATLTFHNEEKSKVVSVGSASTRELLLKRAYDNKIRITEEPASLGLGWMLLLNYGNLLGFISFITLLAVVVYGIRRTSEEPKGVDN